MKKGREAALGETGEDLTRIAQAPAAILEGRRTQAQARLAQPAFRKFANHGNRVNDTKGVRQFGSVEPLFHCADCRIWSAQGGLMAIAAGDIIAPP
jgi:hypothetical protein